MYAMVPTEEPMLQVRLCLQQPTQRVLSSQRKELFQVLTEASFCPMLSDTATSSRRTDQTAE